MNHDKDGSFTVVEDGYDRRVAHREESGLVQDSGAQQFHGPHPECWQSLMDVDGAAGNKNADELALAGHHTEAHAGIFADLLDFAKGILARIFVPLERCLLFGTCEGCVGEPRLRHLRPAMEPTTIAKNNSWGWMWQ